MKKLLILGETGDAQQLAAVTQQISGLIVIFSLAGRTQFTQWSSTCSFGGEQGLIDYLREHQIDLVIDTIHPYNNQRQLSFSPR
jgi:precorrin-6A/cobalt-precorrin-6A reductase